ncbi:unnamed protein product [Arabis nemorensis]|uniref:Uncharacterized protein n=1 Tax=Arabis nemorensis TaxID=586526 RepID=A0A565AUB8_9BRAS|nr:unnamed protein product [Arabis nemorensis]
MVFAAAGYSPYRPRHCSLAEMVNWLRRLGLRLAMFKDEKVSYVASSSSSALPTRFLLDCRFSVSSVVSLTRLVDSGFCLAVVVVDLCSLASSPPRCFFLLFFPAHLLGFGVVVRVSLGISFSSRGLHLLCPCLDAPKSSGASLLWSRASLIRLGPEQSPCGSFVLLTKDLDNTDSMPVFVFKVTLRQCFRVFDFVS